MITFETLCIPGPLREKLAAMGFTTPTEVQATAIPPILEGQDVILQSQTGTGKTLAYLLPMLARLEVERPDLQAMVLAPTRELAMQIVTLLRHLLEGTPHSVQPLIGGANIRHQVERLKKAPPAIGVGTPGRLWELMAANRLKTSTLKMVVIDEVDHVLDPVFRTEVSRILQALPRTRQTVVASATIPSEATETISRWMKAPRRVQVEGRLALPETLTHHYLVTEERDRLDSLRRLLHATRPRAALAFVNDARRLDEWVSKLDFKGLRVAALQGGSGKRDRGEVLKDFRDGKLEVLLATELAARGLDVPGLTHVFNVELPTDADHYLHRAGRTGRQGQPGMVVSLVTERERFVIDKLSKALGVPITPISTSHGQVRPARD